jgi:hypothetical protein
MSLQGAEVPMKFASCASFSERSIYYIHIPCPKNMDVLDKITPKDMRKTVEEIARELPYGDKRRRILFFMIGWYHMDYKYGEEEE